ncbi:hypothetical protein Hanom_Chr06g00559861 [Helianthus anomalus]
MPICDVRLSSWPPWVNVFSIQFFHLKFIHVTKGVNLLQELIKTFQPKLFKLVFGGRNQFNRIHQILLLSLKTLGQRMFDV